MELRAGQVKEPMADTGDEGLFECLSARGGQHLSARRIEAKLATWSNEQLGHGQRCPTRGPARKPATFPIALA